MSSVDQSVDSQLIEQTKRQIQSLVAEISQLSKQSVAPAEFYGEFLTRVVSALAAFGGAVWTTSEDGRLALQYQINFQQTNLREEQAQKRHARLLYKALGAEGGMLVPPHAGFGDEEEAGNPTEFLLVIAPLKTDLEMVGLVEIFQRSEAAPNVQQGYLRFLLQMCELAVDFLKSHQLRHYSDRQVLWARLEEFSREVHNSLDPLATAYTIANEGRRLIECDRVSVALRRGNQCTIEAVSGQDVFDKRSNTVRLLGRLASAVVATGDPVWYAGDTRDLAPQVEEALQEYVDEAHSKMIAVLPLGRPKPDQEADRDDREDGEAAIGALIVEQIEDSRVAPSLVQRVDVVCRHSSSALANSVEHQSLFLMPVWRAIGKSRFLVQARTLPKTISISVAVVVALIFLVICPYKFQLYSKGTLEPQERRDVFAGVDGVVMQIGDGSGKKLDHGAWVKKGDVLLVLRNTDLQVAEDEVRGQLEVAEKREKSLLHLLADSRQLRPEQREEIQGQLAEAQTKVRSLTGQMKLYAEKLEELVIRSPIDGQLVTWDLERRLLHRPVQRGQALLRVANPNGEWQVELRMPEDRMGYVTRAQNDIRPGLPVSYILATDPGTTHIGEVREIRATADVEGEEGNVVLIKVDIDENEVDPVYLRPGAEVNGKVYCGYRSIGFVWFHDLLAFIRSRVLFRI